MGVLETRRHYSNYFRGIPNFKPVRTKLVTSNSSIELFDILEEILEKYSNYQFIAWLEIFLIPLIDQRLLIDPKIISVKKTTMIFLILNSTG